MTTTHRIALSAFTALLILACAAALIAQPSLERPRVSPRATVSQKIGVTDVSVNFHRPGVKGRQIWGGLVPYDQVWRTGANEVTTISFADPVTVGGVGGAPLAAGTYGLFTIPRAASWTVIFSGNTTTWGTDYDSSKDVLKIEVTPKPAEATEWMTFSFTDLSDTAATLELRWEKLSVPVRIGVKTVDVILAKARKEFSAGADTGRWQMLRQAAGYALSQNVSLDEALSWIDRSLAVNRNFQSLCVKSDVLARFGDAAKSAAVLNEAVAEGKEQEAVSYAQSARRDDRAARAVEVLEKFADIHGGSYALSRALGESYDAAGDRAKALSNLEAAAAKAPGDAEKEEVNKLIKTINEKK
jgi:hypothetical protein